MLKFYKNRRFLWYLFLLALLVQAWQLTIAGCSHTTPYYHPELHAGKQQDVEPEGALHYRLLLLGDGGQPKRDEPVLQTLGEWARASLGKTSIVFLGDNMYPEGLTTRKRDEAEARLGPQLAVVKDSGAHGLFIPGNHDWASGRAEGYSALLAQEQFINHRLPGELNFLPSGGSPGPVALELPKGNPTVRLIVLDTQWWLHRHEKPQKSPEVVIEELIALLDTELPVIVVGHHPLETYGMHGGFFDWKVHLFPARAVKKWLWVPVPILGSVYPLGRWHLFRYEQDLNGSENKKLVAALKGAFAAGRVNTGETPSLQNRTPLLIYAAGHEHSLQILKGDVVDYLLVSGAAASQKVTAVGHGNNTLFAHSHAGFMAIDFLTGGQVLLQVVEPEGRGIVFDFWLKQ